MPINKNNIFEAFKEIGNMLFIIFVILFILFLIGLGGAMLVFMTGNPQ